MKKLLFIFGLLGLGLTSCNKPTTACIEMSQTSVNAGGEITFTSCSEESLSYAWYITGPAGSPENSMGWSEPTFTRAFSVSGSYEIELTAYEKYSFIGEQDIATATFIVN